MIYVKVRFNIVLIRAMTPFIYADFLTFFPILKKISRLKSQSISQKKHECGRKKQAAGNGRCLTPNMTHFNSPGGKFCFAIFKRQTTLVSAPV
jgi:hypothetical protein